MEPVQRYKEDYRRTTRNGQKVYCLIDDPESVILADEFKTLPARSLIGKIQSKFSGDDTETSVNPSPVQQGKQKKSKSLFGLGKDGTVLSKREAEELEDPFKAALKDDCKYADQFLWWYSKDASQPQIWSDMDNEEIDTLATVLLKRAQRSAATAAFVRNVVDGADYISTAVILVPRVMKTTTQLSKRPRQPRKRPA